MERQRKAQSRVTEYVSPLGENARKRHYHETARGKVQAFAVQLEVFVAGECRPVIRYDSAHGFAHRDRYFLDGRSTKTELQMDFHEALLFADEDVREHWRDYQERFMRAE